MEAKKSNRNQAKHQIKTDHLQQKEKIATDKAKTHEFLFMTID